MRILEMLDDEQRAAACAPQGSSVVLAGAGTGKTTTLTARIAWLVTEGGLDPSSIVAVTFTNRAAKEIRERVERELGCAAHAVRLGTFHSLCARMLRRHAAAAGFRDPGFTVADEEDSRALMEEASLAEGAWGPCAPPEGLEGAELKEWRSRWETGLKDFAKAALRQVGLWKSWGLSDTEACEPARPRRDEQTERFAAAYGAYQYALERRNMADFGDLVLKAVMLLRGRPDILEEEAARVSHLLVDEAQDANPVQVEWVRLMSSWHGGVTAVGDEDQNIYGFQGGYKGAMADMAGPSASWRSLVSNRRCTDEILRPANLAVSWNRRRDESGKTLSSGRAGSPVRATAHATEAGEAAWIAARVREICEAAGDGPAPTVALLFRAAHLIPPFEEALARKGIPCAVTSGRSLLDREEARDLLAMARAAVNPHDDIAFRRLAARPPKGLGPQACEAICSIAEARDLPFSAACAAAAANGSGLRREARSAAAALGRTLSLLAGEARGGAHAWDVISLGLAETGYLEWLGAQEHGEARRQAAEAFHRLADGYDDVSEFVQEVALLSDTDGAERHSVRLCTMHSAKGLEFDHVFCPAFSYGSMPSLRAVEEGRRGRPGDRWDGPRGGGIEEERRLAHVAFTRARHGLDVSFSWRRGNGRGREAGPSSFLAECDLAWEEKGPATTADLGRVRSGKKRAGRAGFRR